MPETPAAGTPADGGSVGTPPQELARSVQVRATEYALMLSRSTVAAGEVKVEFNTVDAGDPHDLHVRDGAGVERNLFGETAPGLVPPPRQAFTLAAGDYVLFCAVPGHEALGMSAPLSAR